LRPQSGVLRGGELEHEIGGEPVEVTPDLLVETLGGDAVEAGEFGIQEHALAAQDEDGAGDVMNRHGS
jgi:hypothetical protein